MQTTHHAHANFKRKEKKYVLNQGDYLALMGLIGEKLEEDEIWARLPRCLPFAARVDTRATSQRIARLWRP